MVKNGPNKQKDKKNKPIHQINAENTIPRYINNSPNDQLNLLFSQFYNIAKNHDMLQRQEQTQRFIEEHPTLFESTSINVLSIAYNHCSKLKSLYEELNLKKEEINNLAQMSKNMDSQHEFVQLVSQDTKNRTRIFENLLLESTEIINVNYVLIEQFKAQNKSTVHKKRIDQFSINFFFNLSLNTSMLISIFLNSSIVFENYFQYYIIINEKIVWLISYAKKYQKELISLLKEGGEDIEKSLETLLGNYVNICGYLRVFNDPKADEIENLFVILLNNLIPIVHYKKNLNIKLLENYKAIFDKNKNNYEKLQGSQYIYSLLDKIHEFYNQIRKNEDLFLKNIAAINIPHNDIIPNYSLDYLESNENSNSINEALYVLELYSLGANNMLTHEFSQYIFFPLINELKNYIIQLHSATYSKPVIYSKIVLVIFGILSYFEEDMEKRLSEIDKMFSESSKKPLIKDDAQEKNQSESENEEIDQWISTLEEKLKLENNEALLKLKNANDVELKKEAEKFNASLSNIAKNYEMNHNQELFKLNSKQVRVIKKLQNKHEKSCNNSITECKKQLKLLEDEHKNQITTLQSKNNAEIYKENLQFETQCEQYKIQQLENMQTLHNDFERKCHVHRTGFKNAINDEKIKHHNTICKIRLSQQEEMLNLHKELQEQKTILENEYLAEIKKIENNTRIQKENLTEKYANKPSITHGHPIFNHIDIPPEIQFILNDLNKKYKIECYISGGYVYRRLIKSPLQKNERMTIFADCHVEFFKSIFKKSFIQDSKWNNQLYFGRIKFCCINFEDLHEILKSTTILAKGFICSKNGEVYDLLNIKHILENAILPLNDDFNIRLEKDASYIFKLIHMSSQSNIHLDQHHLLLIKKNEENIKKLPLNVYLKHINKLFISPFAVHHLHILINEGFLPAIFSFLPDNYLGFTMMHMPVLIDFWKHKLLEFSTNPTLYNHYHILALFLLLNITINVSRHKNLDNNINEVLDEFFKKNEASRCEDEKQLLMREVKTIVSCQGLYEEFTCFQQQYQSHQQQQLSDIHCPTINFLPNFQRIRNHENVNLGRSNETSYSPLKLNYYNY